jgi:hypothetical protein
MNHKKQWAKLVKPDFEHVLDHYPNIRILGPNSVAVLLDGSVIHVSELEGRMP